MNIGIDIDGVLTDIEKFIIDYGTKFSIEEKEDLEINQIDYDEIKTFNWTQEQADKFWETYFLEYAQNEPQRKFASNIINKLKNEGNKIYIITARNNYGLPSKYYGKIQEITKKWLENQNINYDNIIFCENAEKLGKCQENDVQIMIEDSPKNIKNISSKIKVIKFDCKYNKEINGKNIITAYSWYHIYDIINKTKNI